MPETAVRKVIAVWLLSLLFSGINVGVSFAEGLTGYYYNRAKKDGPVVTGIPDYKAVDATIDFATATWDWAPFGMSEHFSVYWVGWLYVEHSGRYVFATFSDDGSSFYVDEARVVDNGRGRGEPSWASGDLHLSEGYHKIEIVYYNWKGSSGMGLYWDFGNGYEVVPTEVLFPADFSPPVQ